MQMQASSSTPLVTGSKLYDVIVRSLLTCQSRCLAENTCSYAAYNDTSLNCSLYTNTGSGNSVTGKYVLVFTTKTVLVRV
jgi:hypothetical protein